MNTTGSFKVLDSDSSSFTQIITLDYDHFPKPWKMSEWVHLNWDHHKLFSYSVDQKVVGFSLFSFLPDDDTAHLLKICMLPEFRGKGETQRFWSECLLNLKNEGISSLYLEVEFHNRAAISFYSKSGFKTLRHIKGYYSDGSDALTMQMTI